LRNGNLVGSADKNITYTQNGQARSNLYKYNEGQYSDSNRIDGLSKQDSTFDDSSIDITDSGNDQDMIHGPDIHNHQNATVIDRVDGPDKVDNIQDLRRTKKNDVQSININVPKLTVLESKNRSNNSNINNSNTNNSNIGNDRMGRGTDFYNDIPQIQGGSINVNSTKGSEPAFRDNQPVTWFEQSFNPRQYDRAENLDQIATIGGKTRNDMLVNNMVYSDFNRMPPSFNANDFEYGYSYLPPKDWYPLPPYPPVCVSSRSCLTQPVYSDNDVLDFKEWRDTQKFTPPDSFNTTYITNELNSKY